MNIDRIMKNKNVPEHILDILSQIDQLVDNNLSPSVSHFCPDEWRELVSYFGSDIVYRNVRAIPIEIKNGC